MQLPPLPPAIPVLRNPPALPAGAPTTPFVHSSELLILAERPFFYSNTIYPTPGLELLTMLQYDGTHYNLAFEAGTWIASAYLNDYDEFADALEAQTYLQAKFDALAVLVATAAIDPEQWPWTVTSELYTGPCPLAGVAPVPLGATVVNQPALRFTRGEPVGVGNIPYRDTPILAIPNHFDAEEGRFFYWIENLGTIFIPGQDAIALAPLRWGINRGVAPCTTPETHDHTPNDPYIAPPPPPP